MTRSKMRVTASSELRIIIFPGRREPRQPLHRCRDVEQHGVHLAPAVGRRLQHQLGLHHRVRRRRQRRAAAAQEGGQDGEGLKKCVQRRRMTSTTSCFNFECVPEERYEEELRIRKVLLC